MKNIADVEAGPEVPPRTVPSPKHKVDKIAFSNIDLPYPDKNSLPKKPKAAKAKGKGKIAGAGKTNLRSPERVSGNKEVGIETNLFKVIGNPDKMTDAPAPKKKVKGKEKFKRRKEPSVTSNGTLSVSSGSDGNTGSMGSMGSMGSDMTSNSEGSDGSEGSSYADREKFAKQRRKEEIMQEKIEMLTRISKMSKDGFTATKKWTLKDDIDEIRFECYRMTRENNSKKAVKKMQHILISVATMIEFANGMVNPFNLKLQGFSQNMMLTVSDYDDSLEELHHKWSGRTSFGPEMTIMLTFVSSAIFQHAGNVASAPQQQQQSSTQKKPPGKDMSSVLGMFSNMMPKPKPTPPMASVPKSTTPSARVPGTPGPTPVPTAPEPVASDVPKKRRTMKGPSSSVLNGLVPSMTI